MAIATYAQGIQTSFLATTNARAIAARKAAAADQVQTVQVTPKVKTAQASGSGSFFDDVLDVINPLQHIPVVSTLYRAITGDKIGDLEQVAGDTLYGGLTGLASSIGNLIFKDVTGKSLGDTVLAWAEDATGIGGAQPTVVAQATSTPAGAGAAAPVVIAQAATSSAGVTPHAVAPTSPGDLAGLLTTQTPHPIVLADAQSASETAAPARAGAKTKTVTVDPAQATMLADPNAFMAALKAKGIDPQLAMRAMMAYEKSLGLSGKAAAAQP